MIMLANNMLDPNPVQSTNSNDTALRRYRILVVDDNHDSALSLAMVLTIMGHETRTAHDGETALATAEEFHPDVVLLDIGLPKMNGHEVCRHLRERPWGKDLVVIALTGWGQSEDRRQSQDAGFDGHLVKPVSYETFAAMLRSIKSRGADTRSRRGR